MRYILIVLVIAFTSCGSITPRKIMVLPSCEMQLHELGNTNELLHADLHTMQVQNVLLIRKLQKIMRAIEKVTK